MPTERLYYLDSHLTEFEAHVTSVIRDQQGRTVVALDRTLFYPTSGGQPFDTGTIGEALVIDVIDDEQLGVLHIIERETSLQPGALITGRINQARRRDHLQQHTAQHILSAALIELYAAETRGFRMFADYSEIDVQLNEPSDERIERAVELANDIVWQNRLVRIHLNVTADKAARLPLRKQPSRTGELRIIEIADFDWTPCGGTHAHATGEVGCIFVRSHQRAKGMTRLEFVAGQRALSDYRKVNNTTQNIAALFSVHRDDAATSVERAIETNKLIQRRVNDLEAATLSFEATTIINEAITTNDNIKIIHRTFEARDAETLKRLAALLLAASNRTIALLGSTELEGSSNALRLVFARSTDAPGDMNNLMRAACQTLNGRGGGRPDFAQGGGHGDATTLSTVIEAAADQCRQT